MATIVCDTLSREFPSILSCIVDDGYSKTQLKPRKYLGNTTINELLTIRTTVLLLSEEHLTIFAYWWYNEIQQGNLDFTITLPIFGVTQVYTVKMTNDLTIEMKEAGNKIRTIPMILEVQDDIPAIIEASLLAQFCAIH